MLLGQVVVDNVIVGFVGDKYVLLHREVGRSIQGAGRNADVIASRFLPKQITAADPAESALGGVRRFVPAQWIGSRQFEVCRRGARHGREVSARSTALRAVAGDDSAQLAANPVTDSTAQASAGVCRFLFCHVARSPL